MRKAEQPERSIEMQRKNFLPNLSMQRIVHRLLGAADTDIIKLSMKTLLSGIGVTQNSLAASSPADGRSFVTICSAATF